MKLEKILTDEEVREILGLDNDYSESAIEDFSNSATYFIFQKTGYKNEPYKPILPLAKQLARLYLRSSFYGNDGHNMSDRLDYTIGINSLIKDLEDVVRFGGLEK